MTITNCDNTKQEREAQNLCGFQKAKCSNQEGSLPITIYRWGIEHDGRVWGMFIFGWILKVLSDFHNFRKQIQDNFCHKLENIYLEGDAF